MTTHRIEEHDLDGRGAKSCHVYDMEAVPTAHGHDYWAAVTDVGCPCCAEGIVRWAEADYVPGYRICDVCGRHFLARGTAELPTLIRVGNRRD